MQRYAQRTPYTFIELKPPTTPELILTTLLEVMHILIYICGIIAYTQAVCRCLKSLVRVRWPYLYEEAKQLVLIVALVVLIHAGLVIRWSAERHLEVANKLLRVQFGLVRRLAEVVDEDEDVDVEEEEEPQDEAGGSASASTGDGPGDERDAGESEPEHDHEEEFETLQSPTPVAEDVVGCKVEM